MSDTAATIETATATATAAVADSERQPCEIWTRVMGYHRPLASFNSGKKGEFAERVCFAENSADNS